MLRKMLTRIERAQALDGLSEKLQAAVQAAVKPQALADLLHGTWLGHPLHPVLVQVPVGAFVSAAVLDLMPGGRRSAERFLSLPYGEALDAALVEFTNLFTRRTS